MKDFSFLEINSTVSTTSALKATSLGLYSPSAAFLINNWYVTAQLGLWLRLECSLDSLSIDSAHVIYVAEGHNVGAERQSSVMTLRKPIVTWII